MNTIALPRQTNLSEELRVIVKRMAASNGGLVSFLRSAGIRYRRGYEQLNRNQGVLVDMLPALTQAGIDEPLRRVADACGYDVTPKMQFLRKAHAPDRPVRSHALDLHHATAAVTMTIEAALADKLIDEREREIIKGDLHKLRRKMAELEMKLEVGK